MINANIWIRDPYPFRYDEIQNIQNALQALYDSKVIYLREWPVDYVSIDGCNITTAKQIAATMKVIHRQWAIGEKKVWGRDHCQQLEIDIREASDGRPDWAKESDGRR